MKALISPGFGIKGIGGIAIPALLWWGLTTERPVLLTPSCAPSPERCRIEDLWIGDRIAVLLESGNADLISYYTQNTAGSAAFLVPLVFHLSRAATRATPIGRLASLVWTDWVTVGQVLAWNGVGVELSHLLWQRPRPFVYQNPTARGQDPQHYTSFYSGHTSSAAAMTLVLVLLLASHEAPHWLLIGATAMGQVLVAATALFRTLAGRHFPTDTWVAVVAGMSIAYGVAAGHGILNSIKSKK